MCSEREQTKLEVGQTPMHGARIEPGFTEILCKKRETQSKEADGTKREASVRRIPKHQAAKGETTSDEWF